MFEKNTILKFMPVRHR